MAKELATQKDNAPATMANKYAAAANKLGSGGEFDYLSFSGKKGDFLYGANPKKELEHGSQVIFNFDSMKKGFICWINEAVKDEKMESIFDAELTEDDLPDYEHLMVDEDDGWQSQVEIQLYAPEAQRKMLLKGAQKGLQIELGRLLNEFANQIAQKGEDMLPIVELDAKEMEPKKKKYDPYFAPVFDIVDWIKKDELDSLMEEASPESKDDDEDDPSNYAESEETAEEKEEKTKRKGRGRKF